MSTVGRGAGGGRRRSSSSTCGRQQSLAVARDSPQPDNDEHVQRADCEHRYYPVEETLGDVERRERVLVVLHHCADDVRCRVVTDPEHVIRSD